MTTAEEVEIDRLNAEIERLKADIEQRKLDQGAIDYVLDANVKEIERLRAKFNKIMDVLEIMGIDNDSPLYQQIAVIIDEQ